MVAAALSNINWHTITIYSKDLFPFKKEKNGLILRCTAACVCRVTTLGDEELKMSKDAE